MALDLMNDRRVVTAIYVAILGAKTAAEVVERVEQAVKILHERDAAQGLKCAAR